MQHKSAKGKEKGKAKPRRKSKYDFEDVSTRRALAFDIGEVNHAHALVALDGEDDFTIEDLGVTNLIEFNGSKAKNAKNIPARVLTSYMVKYLSEHVDKWTANPLSVIVIEQQAEQGTKLRILSIAIQVFFQVWYELKGLKPPPILFQSGSQKMKVEMRGYKPRPLTKRRATALRKNGGQVTKHIAYKMRKERVLDNFLLFIAHYPKCRKWQALMNKHEDKQDDLADAAFHAVFWLLVGRSKLPKGHPGILYLPATHDASSTTDTIDTNPFVSESEDDEDEEEEEEVDSPWGSNSQPRTEQEGGMDKSENESESDIDSDSDNDIIDLTKQTVPRKQIRPIPVAPKAGKRKQSTPTQSPSPPVKKRKREPVAKPATPNPKRRKQVEATKKKATKVASKRPISSYFGERPQSTNLPATSKIKDCEYI